MIASPRILIADRGKMLRDSLSRLLTRGGYSTVTAENGQGALDILAKESPDVILLDPKMPPVGGKAVLDIIAKTYQDIPVIIVTAHGTLKTAMECMRKGACDVIAKSVDGEALFLAIERAAEKRRVERQARQYQEEMMRTLLEFNTEKKRLKTIINCIANGVMVTNRDQEVVLHNPALVRLMGISEPMEGAVPVTRIVRDDSLIAGLKQIQETDTPEEELLYHEIRAGNHDLRAVSAPVLGPHKNVFWQRVGAVTVFEDITAFKQLDQLKTDFVNMVTHELRSPVVSIRQLFSVLLEGLVGPLEEKQEELLKRGLQKIDQLLDLINELLEIAHLQAGKVVQHREPVDIGKIMEDTVVLMEPRAKKQGIVLTHSGNDLRPVQADPKNIGEVFTNLITNAINYSPDGGRVRVTAKGRGEYVEIKVADTGIGISPEELPKIFDDFYRVKHPKTRGVTGTGLGLAIVKGIVDALGGSIDVESTLGKGTTFRIVLPVIA